MLSKYIDVGEVLRPQGIEGLVKIRPDTEAPERFLELKNLYVRRGETYEEAQISDVSVRDGFVYLRLNGVKTRNEAEAQRGSILSLSRSQARQLPQGEWFVCDLIGCRVTGAQGTDIGVLRDVLLTGPNPVLVIGTKKGSLLVAMMKFVLSEVDPEAGRIVLNEARLPEVAVYE